jgi:protoporphyrinogen IX oxidase
VSSGFAAAALWLKALHIIAVIAWMAGLLYLPRLYVYHADAPIHSSRAVTFETMERLLLRAIMLPAAAMTYVFGLLLVAMPGAVDWHRGWIWAKLALVLLLTGYHVMLEFWRHDFAEDRFSHSPRFYRIVNEVPTVAMIAIVVLVVVKPF